jgi:hypothetical protein
MDLLRTRIDLLRTVDVLSHAQELPAEGHWTGSRRLGTFYVVLGLGLVAFAVHGVLESPDLGSRVHCVALGAGSALALCVLALGQFVSRRDYCFTPEWVECRSRGLFRQGHWRQPMSAYRGVLGEAEFHRRPKIAPHTLYKLVLQHGAGDSHSTTLYQSPSEAGLRAAHELYARVSGLPALVETQDGLESRDVADLDKPVSRRVEEGSVQIAFSPWGEPPGMRLRCSTEGDTFRIAVRWRPLVAVLACVAFLVGVLLLAPERPGGALADGVRGAAGRAAMIVGALLWCWFFLGRAELLVSPSRVRRHYHFLWVTFARKALEADDVEEVLIANVKGYDNAWTVQVVSDDGVISFGRSLSKVQRRWVRDCIISVLSAPARAAED